MNVEHAIEIEKSFDEVWAVFDNPSLQPEWLGIMKTFKQVKGDGNQKGAVQSVIFTRDSGDTELTVTILDYAEGMVKARYEGMQLPFVLTSTFSEIDADTSQWHADIEVRLSLIQKALTPVLKSAMGDLAVQMGNDFKKYVEG